MTMRTRQPLVCECGHEGYPCLAENDQPYSSLWESYTLDGFSRRQSGYHELRGKAEGFTGCTSTEMLGLRPDGKGEVQVAP